MVGWDTYFERLGPQGLRLVVAGLLDEPAERARQVVDQAADDPDAGPALLERLDAAAGELDADRRDEARIREELAAVLRNPDPGAARLLHRLARPVRPLLPTAELRVAAEVLASGVFDEDQGTRPKWTARLASERPGMRERELEQDRRELEARVRQLEAQAARLGERSSTLEAELGRRLAELQQVRLADRAEREERRSLEREVARLEKRIEEFKERRARESTGAVTAALRRLTTEQRRAVAQLEKLRRTDAERRDALREQSRRLGALAEAIDRLAAQRESEARVAAAAQDALLRELDAIRVTLAARPADGSPRRIAPPGAPPRVGLFVDVQNMFYGAREKGARLDFEALLESVSAERQLVRAVAYLVETRDIDQSAFIHLLQVKNYEVKRKPLRIRPDGSMKGNWDLEMALDVLTTAEHLDVVVLVTGDGDFVPLVRQLRLRGVTVEVYGFPRSSAPDLREVADRFVAIPRRLLRPLATERRARPAGANGTPAPAPAPATAAPDPAADDDEPDLTHGTTLAPAQGVVSALPGPLPR